METREDGMWTVIGATIVLLTFLVIAVHATVGWSDVTAAWVQALGSLIGLAVAIWVPVHLRNADRAQDEYARIDSASVSAVRALSKVTTLLFLLDFVVSRTEQWVNAGIPLPKKAVEQLFISTDLPTDRDVESLAPLGQPVAAIMAMIVGDAVLLRTAVESVKVVDDPELQKSIWVSYTDLARDAQTRASTMSRALKHIAYPSGVPDDRRKS